MRGLSKLIKEDPGNIQRELKRLTKGGFLIVTKKGNTSIYQTNKQFPILKELQSIIIKSQQADASKTPPSKTIGWRGFFENFSHSVGLVTIFCIQNTKDYLIHSWCLALRRLWTE